MMKSRLKRFCGMGNRFICLRGENALKRLKRGLFSIFRIDGISDGRGWGRFWRNLT